MTLKMYSRMLHQYLDVTNKQLRHYKPSWLVLSTVCFIFSLQILVIVLKRLSKQTSIAKLMRFTRNLPGVKSLVDSKLQEVGKIIREDLMKPYGDEVFIEKLPEKQTIATSILGKLKHYKSFDSDSWQAGRISGTIYSRIHDKEYAQLMSTVYSETMWSNPLHSDVFAGVRKMEVEIVRIVSSMYKGNDKTTGCVTSGGTESIVMACKAYRDYALQKKNFRSGERPEFIVPTTAHAAFEKAANFLNCKITFIPVDKQTLKVDLKAMAKAINSNTCLLVGSAPQFPHGIIDPISEIAKLGLAHNIPVHVDACLGGFLLPFMDEAGFELDEKFDFTVEGVTSISADPHKYGYSPKGISVILYSDKKYIHAQYSIQTNWPGGVYASPTLPGSRPGGLVAGCWAALLYHGQEGYVNATKNIMETVNYIKAELEKANIDGLQIMGKPYASVIAFESNKFNILMLNDKLKALGWNLNVLQYPPSFHLCVTQVHCQRTAENFVKDMQVCANQLLAEPNVKPAEGSSAAVYGMCQTIPDRSIVEEVCKMHLDACLGR